MCSLRSHAVVFIVSLFAAACGTPMMPGDGGGGDGGDDASPRNDRININCSSLAGDEGAVACNQRLMAMAMGATWFVGSRSTCADNPSDPACTPICRLEDMAPENCSFVTATPGCPIDLTEGYTIVVQSGGRRSIASVGMSDNCPFARTGRRMWARVNFDDLMGAVECARITPPAGWGPVRFELCPMPGAMCGPEGVNPRDRCTTQMFRDMMGPYSANVCTRMCSSNADCGPRGNCTNNTCWARFDNRCASTLVCPAGTSAYAPNGESEGPCLPLRPRN